MTRLYKGLIFPDVIQALIDIKIINSHADLLLKLEQFDNPGTTGDASRFRFIRAIEKMMNGTGVTVPAKTSKKVIKQILSKLNSGLTDQVKLSLSDHRIVGGDYKFIKDYFLQQNAEFKNKDMQDLVNYVLTLCEKEKAYFKEYDSLNFEEIRRDNFYISDSLDDEITRLQPDILTTNKPNDVVSETCELVIKSHQYLHLLAIIEQDFYIMYGEQRSQDELMQRAVITRILPSIDSNGSYVSSVKKLIINTYTDLGFSSQDDFINQLCGDEVECPERIKRKLNRWKSGNSKINPKALNEILTTKFEAIIPEVLIVAASLIDNTSRELIDKGFSVDWVVKEFDQYKKYQNDIIKKLGTPYLKTY